VSAALISRTFLTVWHVFWFCRKVLFESVGICKPFEFLTPDFWILPQNRTLRQNPHRSMPVAPAGTSLEGERHRDAGVEAHQVITSVMPTWPRASDRTS